MTCRRSSGGNDGSVRRACALLAMDTLARFSISICCSGAIEIYATVRLRASLASGMISTYPFLDLEALKDIGWKSISGHGVFGACRLTVEWAWA
jgi:hypothetical protein